MLINIFRKNMINYINKKLYLYLLFNFLIVIIDYNVQKLKINHLLKILIFADMIFVNNNFTVIYIQ